MAESRSDLKKKIDELNGQLGADMQIAYKANTNIDGLNEIIEKLEAIIAEKPDDAPADEVTDAFSDDNAVLNEDDASTSDENDSDDESVTEDDEDDSDANMSDDDSDDDSDDEAPVQKKPKNLKQCNGNHSMYEDTKENFPSKYGGRYSRDYLIAKKLITK